MKIEGRGLHGFRLGFSNQLFKKGLEITDVQEIMRHRDIKTTEKHYRKFVQKKLIEKLEKNRITDNVEEYY